MPSDKDVVVKKFRVWDTRGKIMIYPSLHINPLYLTLDGKLVEIAGKGMRFPRNIISPSKSLA